MINGFYSFADFSLDHRARRNRRALARQYNRMLDELMTAAIL
jgi:hypothetical protein